jgi:hypothetical protein
MEPVCVLIVKMSLSDQPGRKCGFYFESLYLALYTHTDTPVHPHTPHSCFYPLLKKNEKQHTPKLIFHVKQGGDNFVKFNFKLKF